VVLLCDEKHYYLSFLHMLADFVVVVYQVVRVIKRRGYKDDHFVLCDHCLPVTVCYTFPLPESGFDREKREKGKSITICREIDGK
jgi:hypothetical protein